ncbi:MAG: hypothetical protein K0S24_2209 [Sphingobacterium sp.]|jgi:F0F1-type ATP synthase assembly protein I|nr:hypothetical protein [uncultured Sphingobacterium sp.]MDF2476726.1 hypothetical protein [Sphingobacterium sp.]
MNTILLKIYQFFTTTTIAGVAVGEWVKIIIALIILVIGIKDRHHLTIWIALTYILSKLSGHIFLKKSLKIIDEK